MKKWKKVLGRILHPPVWLVVILVILCAAAMLLIKNWDDTPVAYAVYVVSFYLLSVLTAFFIVVFLNTDHTEHTLFLQVMPNLSDRLAV